MTALQPSSPCRKVSYEQYALQVAILECIADCRCPQSNLHLSFPQIGEEPDPDSFSFQVPINDYKDFLV